MGVIKEAKKIRKNMVDKEASFFYYIVADIVSGRQSG
jgi:hypothetical protein